MPRKKIVARTSKKPPVYQPEQRPEQLDAELKGLGLDTNGEWLAMGDTTYNDEPFEPQ